LQRLSAAAYQTVRDFDALLIMCFILRHGGLNVVREKTFYGSVNNDEIVKSHQRDGKVKSSKFKARTSL